MVPKVVKRSETVVWSRLVHACEADWCGSWAHECCGRSRVEGRGASKQRASYWTVRELLGCQVELGVEKGDRNATRYVVEWAQSSLFGRAQRGLGVPLVGTGAARVRLLVVLLPIGGTMSASSRSRDAQEDEERRRGRR